MRTGASLFLKMKETPVIIFGAGGVGRALLQQIVESREQLAARNRRRLSVIAAADTQSSLFDPAGLDDEKLQQILTAKKRRQPWGQGERPADLELLREIESAGVEGAIVADLTAAGGMEPLLNRALDLGYGVALANKKPLVGPWQQASHYVNHSLVRYEATVGGGQPVIAALRYLLDTNDPLRRIEGQLSGTLNYLCRRLDQGARFSVALAAAKAKGYTEPDPREDLSGRDVMRKLLILARTAGWPLEAEQIKVESLFPSALAHLSVDEFMVASMAVDPSLRQRVDAAGAAGERLRYVAEVEEGKGSVGLKAVPVESPLVGVKHVAFYTARYADEPLVIGGKGAGAELAAAAVLGDLVDLARFLPG